MTNQIEIRKNECEESTSQENIQNASALLALLHGKTDSITKMFKKEIVVDIVKLVQLKNMMNEKLALHYITDSSTNIVFTFANKKVLSFKSWIEMEKYDFNQINSSTQSINIQWDFFAKLNYDMPQRHTFNLRIVSSPKPSDVFKALLGGGFDENQDFEIQTCTMICRVDFINNTLAEELLNVAARWNELCECAATINGKTKVILFKKRNNFAKIAELLFILISSMLIALLIKILYNKLLINFNLETLIYGLIFSVPVLQIIRSLGHAIGKKLLEKFEGLMETHIFKITTGDYKMMQKIKKESTYKKELFLLILNIIFSLVISLVFFLIN